MTQNFAHAHTPFYIDTKEGKYLVLKAIKVCDIRKVECNSGSASCVLKVDKPTPSCERSMSPCERARSPTRRNDVVPFMRTNMLEDIQNSNRNMVSRILG
ncbi:nucleic acid binding phosphoprotein [Cotia virus SPAn232]|uniref:Nucleic acid binding phosphoprotein n=2 Tax=Cotia virus TaxID=39444 RepID=H6TA26_9POXV|nr:nucleic acid binding phosphoprotein [Cotia virus SPAn232]ADT91066.1 nucleic acid binding phosphoprotein [Cotia virus SPAn232]AIT70663.1 nucleic acid binding phosphoprotein [Cotia virus]